MITLGGFTYFRKEGWPNEWFYTAWGSEHMVRPDMVHSLNRIQELESRIQELEAALN